MVQRSIDLIEKKAEYLNIETKQLNRHSKLDSYVESSIENTFRQKNDTSKKTNKYMDTEEKLHSLIDSVGSSKEDDRQSSKFKVKREFSSEKKNSTIKEASASNLEETIGIATDLHDKLEKLSNA
jgi:hypothetical protein